MGYFRILVVELDCVKCTGPFRAFIQFKTDDDSLMQTYRPGDRAKDLPVGQKYRGIGSQYCDCCEKLLHHAEIKASYRVLANWTRDGKIILKREPAADPVTPDELICLGGQLAENARDGAAARNSDLPGLPDFDIHWLATHWPDKLIPRDPARRFWPRWNLFQLDFRPAVVQEMKSDGWVDGLGAFREDILVVVDDQKRLWPEDAYGNRITRYDVDQPPFREDALGGTPQPAWSVPNWSDTDRENNRKRERTPGQSRSGDKGDGSSDQRGKSRKSNP